MALLAAIMFLLGLIFANFNSLAMEPQARMAGTASSVFGSITTLIASVLGYAVGQAYDGTLVPLTTAYLLFGLATFGMSCWRNGAGRSAKADRRRWAAIASGRTGGRSTAPRRSHA